eukprot:COSAG01_NODE_6557_length_3610_cov_3.296212_3_plen_69_part_00
MSIPRVAASGTHQYVVGAPPYTFSTRFGVVVVLVVGVQLKRRCPNSASIVLILSRAKKLVPESAPKGV